VGVLIHVFLTSALEVSGQLHAQAALPRGKIPQYPLDRRMGGPHNHSGRRGKEKISPLRGLVLRPSRYTDCAVEAGIIYVFVPGQLIRNAPNLPPLLCCIQEER
jgi:hypothetical protein